MLRMNYLLVLGLVVVVAGCSGLGGGGDRPNTVKVTGKVIYNGTPVAGALVTFAPKDAKVGRAAAGSTDDTGTYKLTTFTSGDGAVPASYQISVSKTLTEGGPQEDLSGLSPQERNERAYKQHYSSVGKKAAAPKTTSLLPKKYSIASDSGLTAEVTSGGPNDFTFELKD